MKISNGGDCMVSASICDRPLTAKAVLDERPSAEWSDGQEILLPRIIRMALSCQTTGAIRIAFNRGAILRNRLETASGRIP